MEFVSVKAVVREDLPVHTASASDETQSQLLGWSPRPTHDPLVHGLLKRQSNPRICGYQGADRRNPITCRDSSLVCVSDEFNGNIGCCNPDFLENCAFATTCVNRSQSDECDSDCRIDRLTANCFAYTDTLVDCATGFYDFGTTTYTAIVCDYEESVNIYPTYTNPLVGEEVTPVSLIPLQAGLDTTSDLLNSDLSSVEAPTSDDGAGFSTGATETDSDNSDDTAPDDGVNIGAIVGGVVGGLFVVSIFFCIIAFLILRHRRLKRRDTLAAAPPGPVMVAQRAEVSEQKAEMPVRESMFSSNQWRFGSTSTSEPIMNQSMSTSEPIMLDSTPALSPNTARGELSPTIPATR